MRCGLIPANTGVSCGGKWGLQAVGSEPEWGTGIGSEYVWEGHPGVWKISRSFYNENRNTIEVFTKLTTIDAISFSFSVFENYNGVLNPKPQTSQFMYSSCTYVIIDTSPGSPSTQDRDGLSISQGPQRYLHSSLLCLSIYHWLPLPRSLELIHHTTRSNPICRKTVNKHISSRRPKFLRPIPEPKPLRHARRVSLRREPFQVPS